MKSLYAFLFFFTGITFANSFFQEAEEKEQQEAYEEVLPLLEKALENPGEQELDIRYMYADYLSIFGTPEQQKANEEAILALDKALKDELKVVQQKAIINQVSEEGFNDWGNELQIENTTAFYPYGPDSANLNSQKWDLSVAYVGNWFYSSGSQNHSIDFGLDYNRPYFEVSYEYTGIDGEEYEKIRTGPKNISEYSFTPSLNYSFFQTGFLLSAGVEAYKDSDYNFAPSASGLLALGPWGEKWNFSFYSLGTWQKEFSNFWSNVASLKYNSTEKKHATTLSVHYDFLFDDSDESEPLVARMWQDSILAALQDYSNELHQTKSSIGLTLQYQFKPKSNFSWKTKYKWEFSQNLEEDSWLAYTGALEETDLVGAYSSLLGYLQVGDKYYLLDGAGTFSTDDLTQYKQRVAAIKWRFETSIDWEFISGHHLGVAWIRNKEIENLDETHPDFSEVNDQTTYLKLDYSLEF